MGGLFRFTWRLVKSYGLTLGLRTVFLYLPQPVAACMIVLPPGGSLPALAQVTLPVHPPHPFTYLAASWKVDVNICYIPHLGKNGPMDYCPVSERLVWRQRPLKPSEQLWIKQTDH